MSVWDMTTGTVGKLWVFIAICLILAGWLGWNERDINRGKIEHDSDGWLPFIKQVWKGRRNGR